MPLIDRAQLLLSQVRESHLPHGFDKGTIEAVALEGLLLCEKSPQNFNEAVERRIKELKDLVQQKGADYNAGDISILEYWILGSASIFHEIHKRALRLVSLGHSRRIPRFEDLPESGLDVAAFAIFLLAYEQGAFSPSS